jgi:hypothetical protein
VLSYRNTHSLFKAIGFFYVTPETILPVRNGKFFANTLRTPGNTGYDTMGWLNSVVQSLPKPASLKNYP